MGMFTASRVQSTCGGRLTPHFLCPQARGGRAFGPSAAAAAAGVGAASPGVAAEGEELQAGKVVRKEFVCDEAAEFGKTAFRPRAGPPASRGPARCR